MPRSSEASFRAERLPGVRGGAANQPRREAMNSTEEPISTTTVRMS